MLIKRVLAFLLAIPLSGCLITTSPKPGYTVKDVKQPLGIDEGVVSICRELQLGAGSERFLTVQLNGDPAGNLVGGVGLEIVAPKGSHTLSVVISGLAADIGKLSVPPVVIQPGRQEYFLVWADWVGSSPFGKTGSIDRISWKLRPVSVEHFTTKCFHPPVRIKKSR